MFEFFDMADDYAERLVARYPEEGEFLVDTCAVNDGDKPFETAVQHEDYNGGKIVIVEAYDTAAEAMIGHTKWVERMTKEPLPAVLEDCKNSGISQLSSALGMVTTFERKRR